ncbi:sensor histidine kinase [Streptomyces tubercidicus]|uniref:Two-component sensor histidine kinase n=1 Tax=Streptomyces tubercidicus TaxID=47759 RepID=A0A640UNE8_9ACTN|nr:sensor histidine kinase [Streptomyces tubercidicus]WAU12217.1 sensor histidine kinase [Streptomyces tubercidicus]GFE37608.1 two-component sensor histidine kinase [Streptomyces tubercidicus]
MGRVTPEAGRAPETRMRWFGLWDSYFVICYLVTTGLVFTSAVPQTGRLIAIGALTVIVPWYAGIGRPLMLREGRDGRNTGFAAGLFVLFGVATAVDLTSAFALFAIVPMLMMSLDTRPAVVAGVLGNVVPVTMLWLRGGATAPLVLFVLLASLLGIALSVLLGLWIKRVVRQNKEHAELIEELRRNREQVARLSHQAGIAAERERLAREIHDTLAQSLTSIISLVQAADAEVAEAPDVARKHLALVGRMAKESLAEARAFVADRTPASLRESSLAQALRRQADGLAAQTGLLARFAVEGEERPLPMAVNVVLLRAAQEAGTNVRKHADARAVDLVLRYGEGQVGIVVTDDGRGFDAAEAEAETMAETEAETGTETEAEAGTGAALGAANGGQDGGFGLRGMAARVAEIGGAMSVVSTPGAGTSVEVKVPLDGSAERRTTATATATTATATATARDEERCA